MEFRAILEQIVFEQDRKVVVFSQWRRMLRLANWAVGGLLAKHGARAVFLSGEEKQRRRTQNVVDFHDDPDTRVFFATDAGGVGLNLQRAANCWVNLDLPWNPAVLEQRIGRIYRLGQASPIDVYNLVSEDCIESWIADVIRDKKALFTGLFDGKSDTVDFEQGGGFLKNVEKLVETPKAPDVEETPAAPSYDADSDGDLVEGDLVAAEAGGAPESPARSVAVVDSDSEDVSPAPSPETVRELFSGVNIQRDQDGGLTLRAPGEAAEILAAVGGESCAPVPAVAHRGLAPGVSPLGIPGEATQVNLKQCFTD